MKHLYNVLDREGTQQMYMLQNTKGQVAVNCHLNKTDVSRNTDPDQFVFRKVTVMLFDSLDT